MTDRKPVTDGIPTDVAWQEGRRIYIRCGYNSNLNKQLLEINAKWDGDVGARYVGTTRRDAVLPLVQAHVERIAAATAIKTAGRWIAIPYEAEAIREHAQSLGGKYDKPTKRWAMPSADTLADVHQRVHDWTAAVEAKRQAEREAEKEARAAAEREGRDAAAAAKASREERLIASSGRTIMEDRGQVRSQRLHGWMRRPEAEQRKPQPGDVRKLRDGRRVLVLNSEVWFASQDAIDDGLAAGVNLWEDPGWFYNYNFVVVEPTAEEVEADRQEKAEQDDLTELAEVMKLADRTPRQAVDSLTNLEGATITEDSAGGMTIHGGQITVTPTDEVWYQHPGWYDDYVRTEGRVDDPELIARVRAIIAGGDRRRGAYAVKEFQR
ncbi:hypothetical protein BDK92_7227 [Micromonospora pisi]|uniref:Uncharacterized protein n=1 Tax=Micromonospora pisi TaxID=589240 RepID=A0A495JVY9_9ACTN|nr:hypothetical protein [Micromonospora pisi]RKR92748.1 hypothetical protein BDK92_7227 [Micromonospora pisi]